MSALGCFGRFTLFSPRVSHSNTCRLLSFVCFVLLFGFVALVCFCFLFCECLGIPNSPRSLDLDDRQGLIARSAMQQKKKDACLGMYDCISLISGYWAICLWRSTERVRNVSPSRLTSVLATVLCLVLGVGFCCWLVFSCFGASCLVVFLSSLVHLTLRHT